MIAVPMPEGLPATPEPASPPVVTTPAAVRSTPERVPKITLLLVLGHHFERLVRDGAVKDLAEIARRTGLTRARVTQITNLTQLAPDLQEAILGLHLPPQRHNPMHE